MKKVALQTICLTLIVAFSVIAFAANPETKQINFSSPTLVGDKMLPAGTYRVTINEDSLSFLQTGVRKDKAAESKVNVATEKVDKARNDHFMVRNNEKNQLVLLSVTFRGQETRYVLK